MFANFLFKLNFSKLSLVSFIFSPQKSLRLHMPIKYFILLFCSTRFWFIYKTSNIFSTWLLCLKLNYRQNTVFFFEIVQNDFSKNFNISSLANKNSNNRSNIKNGKEKLIQSPKPATKHSVIYTSLHSSFCLSIHLSIHPSVCLSSSIFFLN